MSVIYESIQIKKEVYLKPHFSLTAIFFTDNGILINSQTLNPLLPFKETLQQLKGLVERAHLYNNILIIKCKLDLTEAQLSKKGLCIHSIKFVLPKFNAKLQSILIKAYHWIQWDEQSRFCSKCGNALNSQFMTPEKKCTSCLASFFPRFSPAVLVLIQKKDKILLARSPHFPPGMYSVIAGFVDIGETAEMTVHREVTEELGIKVGKLEYFRSQTWPFPDSFMIAFKTTYVQGKITINTDELEDARWFSIHALPKLPNKASISRKLIESVFK